MRTGGMAACSGQICLVRVQSAYQGCSLSCIPCWACNPHGLVVSLISCGPRAAKFSSIGIFIHSANQEFFRKNPRSSVPAGGVQSIQLKPDDRITSLTEDGSKASMIPLLSSVHQLQAQHRVPYFLLPKLLCPCLPLACFAEPMGAVVPFFLECTKPVPPPLHLHG